MLATFLAAHHDLNFYCMQVTSERMKQEEEVPGAFGPRGDAGSEAASHMGRHSQSYDQTKITAELKERNSGFNASECRPHALISHDLRIK